MSNEQRAFAPLDWRRIRHMTHPYTIGHPDSEPKNDMSHFYKFGLALYAIKQDSCGYLAYMTALDTMDVDKYVWADCAKYESSNVFPERQDWDNFLHINRDRHIVCHRLPGQEAVYVRGQDITTAEFFMLQYLQLLFTGNSSKFCKDIPLSTIHAFKALSQAVYRAMPDVEVEVTFFEDLANSKWAYVSRLSNDTDTQTLYWPRCIISVPEVIFACVG